MPRIFDNIEQNLLPALQKTLKVSERADFCVGYFNLRGWRHLAEYVDKWAGGDGHCCRLLVGMHVAPSDALRQALRSGEEELTDNKTANREKRRIADEFRRQLMFGTPSNADEANLRKLSRQLRAQKLFVKVYLAHPLHAKLYLLHRQDENNPITGFLGSSNLTFAGLQHQGELNVDVMDHDSCNKLVRWFEDRWNDDWCVDISKELADIIDESWAGERLLSPYLVYLKMAYHLAQDARAGLSEFTIPPIFKDTLLDFQSAAVKIAAHHLNKHGGVIIGDVVGLGKSIIAAALAKVFEEDHGTETLIICPKNLVSMWEGYVWRYELRAKVLPLSKVQAKLPEKTPRYRLVLIDESHNLRNREGKRWRAVRDYIERNDCRTILLTATPYNKSYLDLSAQLALFLDDEENIGIRPEKLIADLGGEHEFVRKHQCGVQTLKAFEKSEDGDDWRDLMRQYMVRRTRSFITQNYAQSDEKGKYLQFADGRKSYFPLRQPKSLGFMIDDQNPNDQYARLYGNAVVGAINGLALPRYGLGLYLAPKPKTPPTPQQAKIIEGLSRAGTRLMGFCRTNLFKRLESAGPAFIQSIERHILRNFVVLHALENDLDIPLGTQDAAVLDTRFHDEDFDMPAEDDSAEDSDDAPLQESTAANLHTEDDYRQRAAEIYTSYSTTLKNRFKWLPAALFKTELAAQLADDASSLLGVLRDCGQWRAESDAKLDALIKLITEKHQHDKLLVFTQFADTARYLMEQLRARGITHVAAATGQSLDPTELAQRFSPASNNRSVSPEDELRVLITTDVLSEGQNLQDAHIIVNYDLPWAIIRLIQRAGRVDRIGQQSSTILCYSFVPADGIERIIRLRQRVSERLKENAEVVGSDEQFFDDETDDKLIYDIYTEKSGSLDGDDFDEEVDLASYAWQIWKNATDADPALAPVIESLPNVVYACKEHATTPKGALVYMRGAHGHDALAWIDENGNPATRSQLAILKAAACTKDTPPQPRSEQHHALTQRGLELASQEVTAGSGALGRPSGARFKTYERLQRLLSTLSGATRDLFITDDYLRRIDKVKDAIYRYPLRQGATDSLNRQIKAGATDQQLFELAHTLHSEGRLCQIQDDENGDAVQQKAHIICSMGLV